MIVLGETAMKKLPGKPKDHYQDIEVCVFRLTFCTALLHNSFNFLNSFSSSSTNDSNHHEDCSSKKRCWHCKSLGIAFLIVAVAITASCCLSYRSPQYVFSFTNFGGAMESAFFALCVFVDRFVFEGAAYFILVYMMGKLFGVFEMIRGFCDNTSSCLDVDKTLSLCSFSSFV
jgi:hypothetical protein